MGRQVELLTPPLRIVSLVPSQTELLADLGLADEVIGITKFCIHPTDWFRNKRRVGGTKTVKTEVIDELAPDLIIGNKEENSQEDIKALETRYPVWMSDILDLEDALDMIRKVGTLTQKVPIANELAINIQDAFLSLKHITQQRPPVRAAYLMWREPYMAVAKGTFIDAMLKEAGFENIFGHLSRYPEVTPKDIAALNPETILLSSEPYPFKEKHIEEIQAICPTAAIQLVDGELFSWYGSRLLKSPDYFKTLVRR